MDEIDRGMLRCLQEDGRISVSDLARRIQLSVAATHARMRRLERDGYIRGYTAIVDTEQMGYDLLCFMHISFRLHQPEEVARFLEEVRQMPEVLECYKVTGEYDCILKVLVRNHRDFDRFWTEKVIHIPAVARTHTEIVTQYVKRHGIVPVDA
jgi:Lrp/AsnC family leucine-responsive transcriptional regulator